MNKICNHCKKPIDDFCIEVSLRTKVFRKTEYDVEEEVVNGELHNTELLCKDCLDKFAMALLNFDKIIEEE